MEKIEKELNAYKQADLEWDRLASLEAQSKYYTEAQMKVGKYDFKCCKGGLGYRFTAFCNGNEVYSRTLMPRFVDHDLDRALLVGIGFWIKDGLCDIEASNFDAAMGYFPFGTEEQIEKKVREVFRGDITG